MLLLHGSIAIPRPVNENDDFAQLLSVWTEIAPGLLPTYAGDHEPVRLAFDASRPQDHAERWRSSTLWLARRARPTVRFSVHGALGRTNTTMHLSIPARDAPSLVELTARLVLALAQAFAADLAIVHTLCEAERLEARAAGRPDVVTINRKTGLAGMGLGFAIPTARDGLESLYWINFFGPRLEAFFGAQTLASAGWESIERVDSGVVARVTNVPPNDATWERFRTMRDQIVDNLGRSAFFPNASRPPELSPESVISGDIYRR